MVADWEIHYYLYYCFFNIIYTKRVDTIQRNRILCVCVGMAHKIKITFVFKLLKKIKQ